MPQIIQTVLSPTTQEMINNNHNYNMLLTSAV